MNRPFGERCGQTVHGKDGSKMNTRQKEPQIALWNQTSALWILFRWLGGSFILLAGTLLLIEKESLASFEACFAFLCRQICPPDHADDCPSLPLTAIRNFGHHLFPIPIKIASGFLAPKNWNRSLTFEKSSAIIWPAIMQQWQIHVAFATQTNSRRLSSKISAIFGSWQKCG